MKRIIKYVLLTVVLTALSSFAVKATVTGSFLGCDTAAQNPMQPEAEKAVWAFHNGETQHYATYATLGDALNNGQLADNDIIEFHGNTTETKSSEISKSNITIKSMDGECFTADYSNFNVTYGTKGVISVTGTGLNVSKVVFQNLSNPSQSPSLNVHLFDVFSGGEITLGKNCTIKNIRCPHTSNGAAVYIKDGSVTVDGATLANNFGMHGAAFYVDSDGVLEIKDTPDDGAETKIENNEVLDDGGCGGGISNYDGTVTVNGGLFKGNKGIFGGGIYNRSKLYVYGGKFTGNSESAITNSNPSTLVIGNADGTGPYIYENTAKYGAAVQIQNWSVGNATAVINGGTFISNHASVNGGALTTRGMNNNITLTINGGTFTENTAQTSGGVIDVAPGTVVKVKGGIFSENIALSAEDFYGDINVGSGGAFLNMGDLYINGGTIENNTVVNLEGKTTAGGAIINHGNLYLDGGTISNNSANNGNGIYQDGNMYLSGSPVFDESAGNPVQDVYLADEERVVTKSGDIDASVLVPVSMDSDDEVRGRDILVSSAGHNVVKTDLQRFDVILETTSLAAGFTPSDAVTSTPVIELKKGGPFYVVSLEEDYPTLQEAVDAAQDSDIIEVLPCADFGVTEYDASYATNITSNIVPPVGAGATIAGGYVYVNDKSLTFKNHGNLNSAVLKDFVIVLLGSDNYKDYTFDNLNFSGVSMIIPYSYVASSGKGFNNIEVKNCYADVNGKTHGLSMKIPEGSAAMGSTWSSGNFFIAPLYSHTANINKFSFHNNHIIGHGGDANFPNVRCISGSMASKNSEVYNNTFGSPEAMTTVVSFIEQNTVDNCVYSVHDNVIYGKDDDVTVNWLCATNGPTHGVQAIAYNNEIFTPNNARPFSVNGSGVVSTKYKVVNFNANNSVSGTATAYHNYINGYCFNECSNGGSGTMDKNIQDGHTYGDGHIKSISESDNALIKKYGLKAEDIFFHGHADKFTGGAHEKHTLSADQYCDRCDDILSAIIITCSGLSAGECAIFKVTSGDAEICEVSLSAESPTKAIMGLPAGSYTVAAESWAWTYSKNPASKTKEIKDLNQVADASEITYAFELTKDETITVKNGEDYKENKLDPASIIGTGTKEQQLDIYNGRAL